MKLALHIAWRYLFARKSHNVINVISAISAVGMAVGTAALIIILSVYNGFDRIIEQNISDLDPDLRVQPSYGKFFDPARVLAAVGAESGVEGDGREAAGACSEKRLATLDPTTDCVGGPPSYVAEGGNGFSEQLPPPVNHKISSTATAIGAQRQGVTEGSSPSSPCRGMSQRDRGLEGTGTPGYAGVPSRMVVASATTILEDNVFLSYDGRQTIVRARGVPDNYISDGVIASHLREGSPSLHRGDIPLASVGSGIASRLNLSPRFVEGMRLYYPERGSTISMTNPAASLRDAVVFPGSTFSISTDIDNSLVLLPISIMRDLLGESGVSGVEIRFANGNSVCDKSGAPLQNGLNGVRNRIFPASEKRMVAKYKRALSETLGPEYMVLDRYQMHPTLFRMMKLEKAAIYLILLFVVIIVAFNIFGSLSMLIIEKTEDMSMIRAMGGTDGFVRNVFRYEGWLISLLGLVAGMILGVGITLLQQHFGLVKLPGNFLVDAYPVDLQAGDVLLTAIGVAAIGFLISMLAVMADRTEN